MKKSRTNILVIIAIVSLLSILFIQIQWMLETAKIKQELFSEKANMVLLRTAEVVIADEETCRGIDQGLSADVANKIDSIFKHYMEQYKFQVNYVFEIRKPNQIATIIKPSNIFFETRLESINIREGVDLRLILPDEKQYILAELRTPFITSIILIVILIVLFVRTVRAVIEERNLLLRITDFLSNMTHEFKTPITNISMAAKFLKKDLEDVNSDKAKHYSEIILEENDKLRMQVEQVLSIASLENTDIPIDKKPANIHELLRQSVKHMTIQIESNNVEIYWQLHASKHLALVDQTHLNNVFRNLIDNAIKYSNSDKRIFIKTKNIDDLLVIEFEDSGIGIDKKNQALLFDKYFRVSTGDVHDVKGFGLGLSYVKKVLDLHQASIQVESELSKGSTFIITFSTIE